MLTQYPRGSGNATVPNDAPIQPPQAFVDAAIYISSNRTNWFTIDLTHSATPATLVSAAFINLVRTQSGGPPDVIATGQAISNVNAILAALVISANQFIASGVCDLSGGSNAAPTSQGLTDKQTLIDAGWTVTTN